MSYKEYYLPYKRIEHQVSLPQLELLATSYGTICREKYLYEWITGLHEHTTLSIAAIELVATTKHNVSR